MDTDIGCTLETCVDPEEVGCNRGFLLEECQYRKQARLNKLGSPAETTEVKPDQSPESNNSDRHLRLPWTGNSLGVNDLELVTASSRTDLVGIVGPYNAGKTTLLTLIYLLLQHGEKLNVGEFSGSLTLSGWENLAANLRWQPGETGPRFPPHTSRAAGRQPGMLHLSIRENEGHRRDFLLTDPPGEWFSIWAQKESAEGAEGARWVQNYADRFFFLVDREALASPERGKARDALKDLARRLSVHLHGRPVAVVWTKSDIDIPESIEKDLSECFLTEFPNQPQFKIQVRFGNQSRELVEEPCLALMNWTFAPERRSDTPLPPITTVDRDDLFLSYRGKGITQ